MVRGSLDDLDQLRAAAAASDGVIHLAFKHEEAFSGNYPAAAAADRRGGVRSSSVRLAPTVHGSGDPGFVAALVAIARARRVSGYLGEGRNHWPAVHRDDAARLFRLALEAAPAGTVLHGVAEEGVPVRAIAQVIARHLGVPATSITPARAGEHFGWLAGFLALDVRADSAWTRERLGWQPTYPGLLDDLEQDHYFRTRTT